MSNENSTTNIPRRIRVGSNAKSGRARKFSCVTYLSELQLEVCLLAHSLQIRTYAYAYHDKDVKEDGTIKEPHIHLVLVTYNPCTVSAIRRWFSGYVDSNGEITTTAQICNDVFSMYDYLTHNTKECREQGKYLYDKSIIKTNDKSGYFRASTESEFDNITLASEMLLKGEKVQDVAKIFGRDFIIHYNTIKSYVNDVLRQRNYGMTLENVLEREYELEIYKLNYGERNIDYGKEH